MRYSRKSVMLIPVLIGLILFFNNLKFDGLKPDEPKTEVLPPPPVEETVVPAPSEIKSGDKTPEADRKPNSMRRIPQNVEPDTSANAKVENELNNMLSGTAKVKHSAENKISCVDQLRTFHQPTKDYAKIHRKTISRVVGRWFYMNKKSKTVKEKSIQGRFFLALAQANYLSSQLVPIDKASATSSLELIHFEDPTNSAPLVFSLLLAKESKDVNKMNQILYKLKSTTHFNSFVLDLSKAIYLGAESASDFYAANDIWSKTPIPEYFPVIDILVEHGLADIGKQLIADGLKSSDPYSDFSWSQIEYVVGKKVLDKLGQGDPYPKFKDLAKERFKNDPIHKTDILADDSSACDMTAMDPAIRELTEFLRSK